MSIYATQYGQGTVNWFYQYVQAKYKKKPVFKEKKEEKKGTTISLKPPPELLAIGPTTQISLAKTPQENFAICKTAITFHRPFTDFDPLIKTLPLEEQHLFTYIVRKLTNSKKQLDDNPHPRVIQHYDNLIHDYCMYQVVRHTRLHSDKEIYQHYSAFLNGQNLIRCGKLVDICNEHNLPTDRLPRDPRYVEYIPPDMSLEDLLIQLSILEAQEQYYEPFEKLHAKEACHPLDFQRYNDEKKRLRIRSLEKYIEHRKAGKTTPLHHMKPKKKSSSDDEDETYQASETSANKHNSKGFQSSSSEDEIDTSITPTSTSTSTPTSTSSSSKRPPFLGIDLGTVNSKIHFPKNPTLPDITKAPTPEKGKEKHKRKWVSCIGEKGKEKKSKDTDSDLPEHDFDDDVQPLSSSYPSQPSRKHSPPSSTHTNHKKDTSSSSTSTSKKKHASKTSTKGKLHDVIVPPGKDLEDIEHTCRYINLDEFTINGHNARKFIDRYNKTCDDIDKHCIDPTLITDFQSYFTPNVQRWLSNHFHHAYTDRINLLKHCIAEEISPEGYAEIDTAEPNIKQRLYLDIMEQMPGTFDCSFFTANLKHDRQIPLLHRTTIFQDACGKHLMDFLQDPKKLKFIEFQFTHELFVENIKTCLFNYATPEKYLEIRQREVPWEYLEAVKPALCLDLCCQPNDLIHIWDFHHKHSDKKRLPKLIHYQEGLTNMFEKVWIQHHDFENTPSVYFEDVPGVLFDHFVDYVVSQFPTDDLKDQMNIPSPRLTSSAMKGSLTLKIINLLYKGISFQSEIRQYAFHFYLPDFINILKDIDVKHLERPLSSLEFPEDIVNAFENIPTFKLCKYDLEDNELNLIKETIRDELQNGAHWDVIRERYQVLSPYLAEQFWHEIRERIRLNAMTIPITQLGIPGELVEKFKLLEGSKKK
jgi:hypothetical protein